MPSWRKNASGTWEIASAPLTDAQDPDVEASFQASIERGQSADAQADPAQDGDASNPPARAATH